MFGFKAGDKVKLKNRVGYENEVLVIVRQFVATTSYLVRDKNKNEFAVDRNEMVKINGE